MTTGRGECSLDDLVSLCMCQCVRVCVCMCVPHLTPTHSLQTEHAPLTTCLPQSESPWTRNMGSCQVRGAEEHLLVLLYFFMTFIFLRAPLYWTILWWFCLL